MPSADNSKFKIGPLIAPVFVPSGLFSIAEFGLIPVIPASAKALGADIPTAGFIAGLVMLGLLLADLPAARFVAALGERKAMGWASAIAGVAGALAFLAPNVWLLGLAVLVMGSSAAVFGLGRHAYMTEHVPYGQRARALSLLGGTFRFGAFIGPLMSAGVIALLGIPWVYVLSLIFWAGSTLSLLLTKDKHAVDSQVTPFARTFEVAKRERGKLLTVGVGAMMIGVLRASRQVGLPLWALVIGLSAEKSTLIIAIAGLIDFALFYTSGQIMDRFGRRWAAVPTMIGLGLTHIFVFTAVDESGFLAIAILMSIANGLGSGLVLTLGADLAPADARPEFLASFRLLIDAGVAATPPLLSALAVVSLGFGMGVFGALGLASAWLLHWSIPRYIKGPDRI